jgi:hypothetical protein
VVRRRAVAVACVQLGIDEFADERVDVLPDQVGDLAAVLEDERADALLEVVTDRRGHRASIRRRGCGVLAARRREAGTRR